METQLSNDYRGKITANHYDVGGISLVIANLGPGEYWRQNPNFGQGHLEKISLPENGKPGTPVFQGQTN